MAQIEREREDLLREATALARRAELVAGSKSEPVFVGFRRDGSFSCYFGSDVVVQFNLAGQVRRGYSDGKLIKAENGQLIALARQRTVQQTALVREPFNPADQQRWLQNVEHRLANLADQLDRHDFQLRGQIPADGTVLEEVRRWLRQAAPLRVAKSPHAR